MFSQVDIDNLIDIINNSNIKGSSAEYITELKDKVIKINKKEKKKDEAHT